MLQFPDQNPQTTYTKWYDSSIAVYSLPGNIYFLKNPVKAKSYFSKTIPDVSISHDISGNSKEYINNAIYDLHVAPEDTTRVESTVAVSKSPILFNTETENAQKIMDPGIKQVAHYGDWVIAVIILSLILIIWAKLFYNKALIQTVESIFKLQSASKMYREKNTLSQRVSFFLNLVFYINTGLFIYELSVYYQMPWPWITGFPLFVVSLVAVFLFTSVKSLLYRILGFVFNAEKETQEFLHNNYIFYKTLGIALFPVIICIPFLPWFYAEYIIIAGLVITGIIIFLQIVRGFLFGIKTNIALFYIFLYLCTLEILPVMLLYKAVMSLI